MLNLQRAVKAHRWNQQRHERDFAAELGLTTKEYNRFEEGKLETDTLMKVLRWLLVEDAAVSQKPE